MWNINVRKQAINDKLQGSIAIYSMYGAIFNDNITHTQWPLVQDYPCRPVAEETSIKKGLLLSLPVKNI